MIFCRFCNANLCDTVLDLGVSPLANSYVAKEQLNAPEIFYPLKAYFCASCGLVQLEAFAAPQEIFGHYDYFSSYSRSWLEHSKAYVQHMCDAYDIGAGSTVVEIASNDGYLLQYFIERGIRALGVEPAENVAQAAVAAGVPTRAAFFGAETARGLLEDGFAADLILGNNVLAHVPDINDFVVGLKMLLKPDGLITMEFPHLANLVEFFQFDTVYHEHFSYLSLLAVRKIFAQHGMRVFDVLEFPTHGGSLRIYACHEKASRREGRAVTEIIDRERRAHLDRFEGFAHLQKKSEEIKDRLLEFLLENKRAGKKVLAYGAAAKGNTLLNFAGIKPDLLPMVADLNPHKQGKFLPGSRIPVISPKALLRERPDYILVLPWNIRLEISGQLADASEWNCKFVTAVPELKEWR